jgi:hypothetical protein
MIWFGIAIALSVDGIISLGYKIYREYRKDWGDR